VIWIYIPVDVLTKLGINTKCNPVKEKETDETKKKQNFDKEK